MSSITNALSRLFGRNPAPIKLITRQSWTLTIDEWRDAPQMVREWMELQNNPTFKAGIDVLNNSHPNKYLLSSQGISEQRRLGQLEGYQMCLTNISIMGKSKKKPKAMPEATFEAEDRK